MPDHLHLIVRINQPLPAGKHLGIVIGAFKGGISRAWWQLDTTVSAASASDSRPPLFEPNYNDHILMRDGQLDNWRRYLRDNPLRYMMRREYPDLFQRARCNDTKINRNNKNILIIYFSISRKFTKFAR